MEQLKNSHDVIDSDPAGTKSGYRAVLIFPVFIIGGFVLGLLFSDTFSAAFPLVNPVLGIIMLLMGLTLRPIDFVTALKKPLAIVLTIVGQFVCMPLIAPGLRTYFVFFGVFPGFLPSWRVILEVML